MFSKLVYFGQEGLLKTSPTASNCFITLRSVLIGTSKVAYFACCQSLACVTVQCTHSSSAEWRWIEGGVNDLTEDSVELTPATEQTICSFHQQLWSKKRQGEDGKMRYKTCVCVWGGFDEKLWMQNAAIIVHLMAVLRRSLIWSNLSGSFRFILNWRTTGQLPELIMFRARKQQWNLLDWLCAHVF